MRVWSRNGHRLKVPELDGLADAVSHRARLDGELVVMAGAVADFDALTDRMFRGPTRSQHSLGFLAFDLLAIDGRELTNEPWQARQNALQALELRSPAIGVVPVLSDVAQAWRCAEAGGWEGIVYKRTGSVWRAGERSNDWRKRKVWTRSKLYVSAFREAGGDIDRVAVVDADLRPRGTVEIFGTSAGDHLRRKVGTASAPNRSGWRSVRPSVSMTVQYRLSPSGRLREPLVLEMNCQRSSTPS